MTAHIQHLPAGIKQKALSPPPALQPARHPLCKESVQKLLCQKKGPLSPPPNQPNFLLCHPKSRADTTTGILRSVALPKVQVVTSEHAMGHQETSTCRLSPHSHQAITSDHPSISEVSRGCWEQCLEKGPKGNIDQSGQATR